MDPKQHTYKLSPSSLSLLSDCPRCFWLHLNEGIKRPAGIFPSLPSGMDKVLKIHFDSFRDKGVLPPELKELDGHVKLFQNIELLNSWRNPRKGIQYTDEYGNLFRGAVDNILEKNDKLIVLDYKTRGYPLRADTHKIYQNQLDIYNYLLRKNGYSTEDYGYLLFYHPISVNKDGDVVFHTDLVKLEVDVTNAERIFTEALKVLNGELPKAAADCQYCEWGKSYLRRNPDQR